MTLATLTAAAAVYFFTRGKVSDPQTSTAPIDSIAVLPFENAAQDPNAEYLSDGITENLINSLSQIPKLRVVPRGRVFRYKGREIDTEKVGRELNVRAVLTGRVVQRGDSLNIQSELVDVAADSQLWGRQYERKFSEIVPVQEEIAKEVSEKLHLRPTGEEQRRLTKRYTENPEAHQLYLKGRYLWNRRTTDTLRRAAEYFQKATDKDPSYALAWAGLADCYAVYPAFSVLPPREAIPKAKEAAIKALAFDETLAEAHAALAYVKNTYDWDWPGAEREFKRAIKLNPNYATAHFWYAIHLQAMGRLDEAIAEAKLAQEADPVSPIIGLLAGRTLYVARRYDQAIEQLHKTLEMDPHFPRAHWWLAKAYEQVGRHEEAVAESQKAVSLSAGEPTYFGQLGHAYAVSGKKAEAQKVVAELKDLSKRRYVAPFDIALVYMGLGDKSRALEWLEKAYEDHSDWLAWIKVWPQFDSLRSEPRFQDLLRRLGLPQ
jgi:TolB-like protein/Flp pilus assembly protein TadD